MATRAGAGSAADVAGPAMTPEAARALFAALLCFGCKRAPTAAEVNEMTRTMARKLRPGDGEHLVWRCPSCVPAGEPS